ncbi:Negative elongation factor D [Durusdinium trenchii]|uniref:Negative elongation factor D n=1 Tax=Durusdinium trenchii TaxID=1381693 RepID=A0ABP0M0Z4_9DINO
MAAKGIKHLELYRSDMEKSVDWIDQLLVDWMINSAKQLGFRFDFNLRKPCLEYLTMLAEQDPLVHFKVAKLLAELFTSFASAREELTFVGKALMAGNYENGHYSWWKDISSLYLPLVYPKVYLHKVYQESPLAQRAPLKAPDTPPAQRPTSASHDAWAEPEAVLQHRKSLEVPDSLLTARISALVHNFCQAATTYSRLTMSQAAAEVVELLSEKYQGTPRLCHLAAGWLTLLQGQDSAQAKCKTLRQCLGRRMVAEFSPERLDRLMELNKRRATAAWLQEFIQVEEWRQVVYELRRESRGRSSTFLSGVTHQISEDPSYKDELLREPSTSETFRLFCRHVQHLLLAIFSVARTDDTLTRQAVENFCKFSCYGRHTYVYSQGILRELIRMVPVHRRPLQCISQVLTQLQNKTDNMVLRMDLRLSPVGKYPDLSALLHSMCRFGSSPRFVATDAWGLGGPVADRAGDRAGDREGYATADGYISELTLTASIWGMPNPSELQRGESEAGGELPDPTKGVRGILESLRSPVFFEALLTRFVDPFDAQLAELSEPERHAYVREPFAAAKRRVSEPET